MSNHPGGGVGLVWSETHTYGFPESQPHLGSSCSPISVSNPHNCLTHESPKPLVTPQNRFNYMLTSPNPDHIPGPLLRNPVSPSHPAHVCLLFFFLL